MTETLRAHCATVMHAIGCRRIAHVQAESGSVDEAYLLPDGKTILLRFASEASTADARALSEIVDQGTFEHVIYVLAAGRPEFGSGYCTVDHAQFESRVRQLIK